MRYLNPSYCFLFSLNIKKIVQLLWENRKKRKENRELYDGAKEQILNGLAEWGDRLRG